jgi:Fe-S-cluster containining protein
LENGFNVKLTSSEIKLSKALEDGLEFSCQMCGSCCRGFEEGEIYLYPDDIDRLIELLHISNKLDLKKFAKNYLKIINDTFFWKEPGEERGKTYKFKNIGFKFTGEDEHCHFLKDNKCVIHDKRPFQCICFPFWHMLVSSRKNFTNYAEKCPGLKTLKGKHYSKEEILDWANREYEMEKEYFFELRRNDFNIFKLYPFLSKDMLNK